MRVPAGPRSLAFYTTPRLGYRQSHASDILLSCCQQVICSPSFLLEFSGLLIMLISFFDCFVG